MKFTKKIIVLLIAISYAFSVNAKDEKAYKKINDIISKGKSYKKASGYKKYKYLEAKEKFNKMTDHTIAFNCKRIAIIKNPNSLKDLTSKIDVDITALNELLDGKDKEDGKEIRKEIQKLTDEKNTLENDAEEAKNLDEKAKTDKIQPIEAQNKSLLSIKNGDWGDIIFRALVGNSVADNADPIGNDIIKGAGKGLAVLAVTSTSEALSDQLKGTTKKLINSGFDKTGSVIDRIINFIFHHGKRPFTENEIKAWQALVIAELKNLEDIVKNAEKNSAHSLEEKLREFEAQDADDKANQEIMLNLWQDYIQDFAYTCQELATTIKSRTEYYGKADDGFGIKSCAARLINKLLNLSKWSSSVKSAKDFASLSEIKTIIVAMQKSVDNYFKNLISQIKPDAKVSSSASSSSSNWRDKHDDKYL
ncbi:MAG: hypothetical protein SZ59_C0001G0200 [candidate division TM6 bacterium GW2011_GWF2_28_16]|nr:MAG: hypothetical protein SZ59_C0001G0200 [candidate division TM6 bacterium GW2011_GWF2_28_16]